MFFIVGCGKKSDSLLRVAATSSPHAEILEFIKPAMKLKGIELDIVVMDDYNMPNRALVDGEVDANFFQHQPYLEAQREDFGYALENFASIHVEPMALYSYRYKSLSDIKGPITIAIPNDPSNQGRALALCEVLGLIKLKSIDEVHANLFEIEHQTKEIEFIEMESPLLSRALEDVDIAIITTNFALLSGLSPIKDSIAIENNRSLFTNILVIREGEGEREELQLLKEILTSRSVSDFISSQYNGAVLPVH